MATGWAGLSWDKAWMMLSGVGNYLLLGSAAWSIRARSREAMLRRCRSRWRVQAAIFIAARHRPAAAPTPSRVCVRSRSSFSARWGRGRSSNFYSQPQDPQMQLNVMPWLTVAWALLLGALLAGARGVAIVLALAVGRCRLPGTSGQLARRAAATRAALKATAALETALPAGLHASSSIWASSPSPTWQVRAVEPHLGLGQQGRIPPATRPVQVDRRQCRRDPPSRLDGRPNMPRRSKRDIDLALDRGHRVVISDLWAWPPDILAGYPRHRFCRHARRTDAIYRMLHDNFAAWPRPSGIHLLEPYYRVAASLS